MPEEDEKLLEKNIDELVLRPISPENLADTILTMLAKRELKRLQGSRLSSFRNKTLL